jgi:D-3-phosphoglycerate dehydrogenase / 2-oxoglutarate reductase
MKKLKILITWRFLIDDIKKYSLVFKKNNISYEILKTAQYVKEKDLLKVIHKYDGIICGDDEISKTVIDKAKKLKVISKWGTGIDSIDKNYANKKNIKVFNTPGAFTNAVAEHAIGLMFSMTRNITFNHMDILNDNWSKRICSTIEGKNIGIIGYGKIGKKIYKNLKSFNPIFFFNDIKKINRTNSSLDRLLRVSDIIFIACDLNKSSKHLITSKELKLMKKNSILINISRGSIVNNHDLIKALKNKTILCAALDVYEKEPIQKNSEFLNVQNCIFTSHNAFNSKESIDKINLISVNNLLKFFKSFKLD